jgi:iron complex outermembrane receptor protein
MFNSKQTLAIAALCLSHIALAQTDADTTREAKLQEVVLSGIRATNKTPVTRYDISSKQLKQLYYGADLPTVLQQSPAIHAYSDNGTGIGYSFFRMRGMDQSRINLTVNGVPINDPENQGTFFNNFADLASSAESIQIQRGVGTSTNGAAAFGGSINILTRNLTQKPSAEVNMGYGSFNSRRLTAEVQTGRIAEKYAMYVRLSNLSTDGFRERSGSDITTYFFSTARFGEKSLLKLNVWGGDASSNLAYMGVDAATLAQNRKANPLVQNERDQFQQHFAQLQYQYNLSKISGINASAYYVRGRAPFFQVNFDADPLFFPYSFYNMPNPIVGSDTIMSTNARVAYRLDQHFVGGFANYFYHTNKLKFDAGFHLNSFNSDHFLEVQRMDVFPAGFEPGHIAYFNTGYKQEVSAFAKMSYNLTQRLLLYGDLQLRHARFQYAARTMQFSPPPFTSEDMQWTFINPKLGAQFEVNEQVSLYSMAGITGREPTRFDYFLDDYATRDVKQSDTKPEQVTDIEAGVRISNNYIKLNANVYYMHFRNAIINTGEVNAFGQSITTNVPVSTRSGIELDATWTVNKYISLIHSSNMSQNVINEITQFYTDTTFASIGFVYRNTTPALTPSIILNQGVRVTPFEWLYADANVRYVSQQFVDNSGSKAARIAPYTLVDARVGLKLKNWLKQDISLTFQINNVLNSVYNPWGNVGMFSNVVDYRPDGTTGGVVTPAFFAAPPRNYFITLTWKI